jgi:DNA-binding response OmpR family regulator
MDPRMEVLEAAGPRQALALCETDLPGIQLALLDMEYPGVDMVELVLSLKRAHPRLAMLGMGRRPPDWLSDSQIRKTRAGYLQKPFDPNHLHMSIHVLMILEAQESLKSPGRVTAGMPASDSPKPV